MSTPASQFSLDLPEVPPVVFPNDSAAQEELFRLYRALQILRLRIAELEARVADLEA